MKVMVEVFVTHNNPWPLAYDGRTLVPKWQLDDPKECEGQLFITTVTVDEDNGHTLCRYVTALD